MTTDKLSQIANWRKCHANIPDGYEVQAVVEAVLDGWADPDLVQKTAVNGVHQSDWEWIAEIIRDHNLQCSVSECIKALLIECRNRHKEHADRMLTIKHRYSGSILFSSKADSLKLAVEEAVRQKVNLSFADLKEANLEGADLKRANLYKANLEEANLEEANLEEANLEVTDLTRANLYRANLKKANLGGAYLERADLEEADLYGVDLYGADLYGASLRGAYLMKANLGRVNLMRVDLEDVNLNGAYLERADGVKLNLVGRRPLFIVGPLGSRSNYLNAFLTDQGLYVKTGCFFGTHDEFLEAVNITHKDNEYAQEYKAALKLIEVHLDLWAPKQEVK